MIHIRETVSSTGPRLEARVVGPNFDVSRYMRENSGHYCLFTVAQASRILEMGPGESGIDVHDAIARVMGVK